MNTLWLIIALSAGGSVAPAGQSDLAARPNYYNELGRVLQSEDGKWLLIDFYGLNPSLCLLSEDRTEAECDGELFPIDFDGSQVHFMGETFSR